MQHVAVALAVVLAAAIAAVAKVPVAAMRIEPAKNTGGDSSNGAPHGMRQH